MRLPVGLASLALAAVAAALPVHADVAAAPEPSGHRRVVLVGMPEPVFAATAAALGPWSIAVEATSDAVPADEDAVAALATAHGATAVAWLAGGELVIYDALDRAVDRRPAAEPNDEVGAAAIALSIKTALRRPVPRLVALPEPPPPVPLPPPPPIAAVEVTAPPLPAARPVRFHVAARVGADVPLAEPAPTMPRVAVRGSLAVAAAGRLAAIVGLEAGPSATVETTTFAGRYSDLTFAGGVEWRRAVAPRWWLVSSAVATLHVTRLAGDVQPMDRAISRSTASPGLDLELAIETGGRTRVGGAAVASLVAGQERYQVRGDDVLVIPAATVGLALRISFQ